MSDLATQNRVFLMEGAGPSPSWVIPLLAEGEACPWCDGNQIVRIAAGEVPCPGATTYRARYPRPGRSLELTPHAQAQPPTAYIAHLHRAAIVQLWDTPQPHENKRPRPRVTHRCKPLKPLHLGCYVRTERACNVPEVQRWGYIRVSLWKQRYFPRCTTPRARRLHRWPSDRFINRLVFNGLGGSASIRCKLSDFRGQLVGTDW